MSKWLRKAARVCTRRELRLLQDWRDDRRDCRYDHCDPLEDRASQMRIPSFRDVVRRLHADVMSSLGSSKRHHLAMPRPQPFMLSDLPTTDSRPGIERTLMWRVG